MEWKVIQKGQLSNGHSIKLFPFINKERGGI